MTNDRTSDTPRTDEVTSWEWTPGLPAFTQLDSHYDKLAELARELERENAGLRAAMERVIRFNRNNAQQQYDDPEMSELWEDVRILREALAGEAGHDITEP